MMDAAVPAPLPDAPPPVLAGSPRPSELSNKLLSTAWRQIPYLKWILLVTGAGTGLLGLAMLTRF